MRHILKAGTSGTIGQAEGGEEEKKKKRTTTTMRRRTRVAETDALLGDWHVRSDDLE